MQFDSILTRKVLDADTWNLAGAYHLVDQGGNSGYLDFRPWQVSMGKDVYVAALNDPDTLADVTVVQAARQEPLRFHLEFGEFDFAALEVNEQKTGERLLNCDNPYNDDLDVSDDPIGEEFDFDDEEEMKRRFGYRFSCVERRGNGVDCLSCTTPSSRT